MNLLGHFVCARDLPRAAQAGSVLGDLLPLHQRRARILPLAQSWEAQPAPAPEMAELVRGVRFHLEVDSRFHRDPLFTKTSAAVMAALEAAGPRDGLKRFLPAHVLAEMYLDHLLLVAEPGLAGALYAALAEPARGLMTRFAGRNPDVDQGAFKAFLIHIEESDFVGGYRQAADLIPRMQRILRRFGQRDLRPAEAGAVLEALATGRPQTERRLLQFVGSMRDPDGTAGDTRARPPGEQPAAARVRATGPAPAIRLAPSTAGRSTP